MRKASQGNFDYNALLCQTGRALGKIARSFGESARENAPCQLVNKMHKQSRERLTTPHFFVSERALSKIARSFERPGKMLPVN